MDDPLRLALVPDEAGLICGYFFEPGEATRDINLASLDSALEAGSRESFAWIHLNLANARARRWLEQHASTSPALREALGDELRVSRIERDEQILLAILNDVSFDFSYEPSQTATLWVQVDHRLMITARHSPLRSVDRLRLAVRNGEQVRSTVDLLELLLQAQADVMVEIVRHVTRQVDRIEDDLLAGRLQVKRVALGGMRRLLVRLQRLLAPEPASLFRLLQHPPHWMSDHAAQKLHAASEGFSVVLQEMSALQERTKLLQEELGAMLNERTGRSLFVLTVVTVLALPINILAGLFGMNVGGVPLAEHAAGFWIVSGVVLAFTSGAALWLVRRSRHL